mmetsp:Transcript_90329/g.173865  ORF Transcript_90329/g.173865 Transcript_90329/m.173865 type:complete len:403 (-) Transcript_90329:50-1258(-)
MAMAFTLPKPMLPLVRLPRPRGTGGTATSKGSPRPSSAPKSKGIASTSSSTEVADTGPSPENEVDEEANEEARSDHERTLILSGLPPGITDDELRDLCGIHGTLVSTNMSDKRWGGRVATVRYKDSESARIAAELMHGHEVLGAKLSVEVGASPAAASTAQRQTTKSRAVCRDSSSAADTEQHSPGAVNRKRCLEGSDASAYSGAEASRTKASHITGNAIRSSKPVFRPSQQKEQQQQQQEQQHLTEGRWRPPGVVGSAGPVKAFLAAHPRRPQLGVHKEQSSVAASNDEVDIFNDEFFARVDERMNKCLDANGKLKDEGDDEQASAAFPPEPPQDFSGATEPLTPRDRSKPSSRASTLGVRLDGPYTALPGLLKPHRVAPLVRQPVGQGQARGKRIIDGDR